MLDGSVVCGGVISPPVVFLRRQLRKAAAILPPTEFLLRVEDVVNGEAANNAAVPVCICTAVLLASSDKRRPEVCSVPRRPVLCLGARGILAPLAMVGCTLPSLRLAWPRCLFLGVGSEALL